MSGKILSIAETRYTVEVQLEWEGKKETVSLLREDVESLSLPPCPAPLSAQLYASLKDKESREKAVKLALELLAKKPYSKQKLYEKLKVKGIPKEKAILGVYMVVKFGYLREEEQISLTLLRMAEQAYGPLRAIEKLETAGYLRKDIEDAIARLTEEEKLDFEKAEQMRIDMLKKKGFSEKKAKTKLYYYGFGDELW